MHEKEQFTRAEVRDIVDKMARTLATLYHFMASEMVAECGAAVGESAVRRAVHKYGEARGRKIREEVLAKGLPLTVANLSQFYDLPLPLAWRSEAIRGEENCVEKQVTYCPFAEEWKKLHGEKLGLIYCEQDLSMRVAYNPELDLQQFTNVLNGDPHCHTIVQKKEKTGR
jgi:hypothetical protein